MPTWHKKLRVNSLWLKNLLELVAIGLRLGYNQGGVNDFSFNYGDAITLPLGFSNTYYNVVLYAANANDSPYLYNVYKIQINSSSQFDFVMPTSMGSGAHEVRYIAWGW